MSINGEPLSRFKFLWIDISFHKEENIIYRVIIIILALSATIIILWKLKEWGVPAIALEKLSHLKIITLFPFIKRKSP